MASIVKKCLIFLLICGLLFPLCASAQTLEEWNETNMWILKEDTELYQQNNAKKVIANLKKDAHVALITSNGDYAVVDARLENGQIVRGQLLRSRMTTVFSDLRFIFNEDGSLRSLEDIKPSRKTASAGETTAQTGTLSDAEAAPFDENAGFPDDELTDEDTEDPGTFDTDEDEETIAPSPADSEAEETPNLPDQAQEDDTRVFHVIYAPRTGKATLREKGDKKAAALGTCVNGKVVTLLEWGSDFSRILDEGKEGYVLTSCVQEHKMHAQCPTGRLTLKGKTDGKDRINLRQKATKNSEKVTALPTGTEITVIEQKNDWSEIIADGIYGFVQNQYVEVAP